MTCPVDHARTSLTDLARAMAEGKTTSAEIVEDCLTRIASQDGELHAFVEVFAESARAAAARLDGERTAGKVRGPLHGIPVAIKDLADIDGRITGFGSRVYSLMPARATAPFVDRLIAAGMVVVGKTHMVEFAFGSWGTNNGLGTPLNPVDRKVHRVPGGSSSGSAVAVAAGLVPVAIGSDTGGSIRIPASLCGVVGLKSTVGLVPTDGVAPLSRTFDTIGPIVRSVDDARLVFEALAAVECPAGTVTPASLTLGIVDPDQMAPVDDDVQAAVSATVERIEGSGIRCVPFRLPHAMAEYQHRNGIIMAAEAYAALGARAEDFRFPMDPFVRRRLLSGREITPGQYREAQQKRVQAKVEFMDKLGGIDFVLLPTTPLPAVSLDQVDESVAPMSRFTRLANYLDLCAISVPIDRTPQGLPVGIQIVARGSQERSLLDLAGFVERLSTARPEKR